MQLAWHNLLHDRNRFLVTVLGVMFAAFLMVFQGSLLAGFLRAASRFVDSSDLDIWITARGVQAFEFGAPLESQLQELAAGVPGVIETGRACMAFAVYRKHDGQQQVIAMVGADTNLGKHFPVPALTERSSEISPESVTYDASDRGVLETVSLPASVEINGRRASIESEVHGFGGFLGVPVLFTSYQNAARYLGFDDQHGMYIVARVAKGYPVREVQQNLRQRLPEVDVLTREQFAHKSRVYWLTKTGAGSAIATAAILGFLIGLVVVSQTIYANTMENIEEYATLKALGASRSFVARIVIMQSLICGAAGSVLGLLAAIPATIFAKSFIPWIRTPQWLPPLIVAVSLLMCALASIASVRSSLAVDPGRVFRA